VKRDHSQFYFRRPAFFLLIFFLLLLSGFLQPHAAEKVLNYSRRNFTADNRPRSSRPAVLEDNQPTKSRRSMLERKIQQLRQKSQANNPVFHLEADKQKFRDRLMGQRIQRSTHGSNPNLKSNQTRFMGKMNELEGIIKNQTTNTSTVPGPPTTSTTTLLPSLTGSISGIISDTANNPLGGIQVVIVDTSEDIIGGRDNWSDSEGHYLVNDIPTGDYYVAVLNIHDYSAKWYQDADPFAGDPPPVHVDAPSETLDIDITLEEGGSLSGRIVDQAGYPLEGIGLDVYDYGNRLIHYCCSDADGRYKINGLPTGDYLIKTWNDLCYLDEWYALHYDDLPVHVDLPNETPGIDFTLMLGGAISGQVTLDPSGEGIEGVQVRVYEVNEGMVDSITTDANGYYSVCGLKTGDYYVWSSGSYDECYFSEGYQGVLPWEDDPPPVHVDLPSETPNIDFTFEEGGSISGRIVDPTGNPLEGVQVSIYDPNENGVVGYGTSDSEGYYRVKCLLTGDYYVHTQRYECYHQRWYNDALPEEDDPPVHVDAPNETPNIDFTLAVGGTISGRILDPSGNPLEQVRVEAYDFNNWVHEGWTDSEGYYSVCGLHTGSYFVQTYYCEDEWYQGAIPWEDDPPPVYVVVPNETQNVDFIFEGWGSISGRVVDPTGVPIEHVWVSLVDGSGNWTSTSDNSDSEGNYTVNCLLEGLYYVGTRNDVCYIDEWYQNQDPEEASYPPIQVNPPDETPNIDFTLEEGGSISGRIVDAEGNPFEWAAIQIYDSSGSYKNMNSYYIPDGSYSVCGLATGDYYIIASGSNGYGGCSYEGWYDDANPHEGDPPPIRVDAPNETPNVDFIQQEGGTISGRIVDSTGAPLGWIDVRVYDSNKYWVENGHSDSEGYYTVNCLTTGDYYVKAGDRDNGVYSGKWYQDADPDENDPPPVHVDAPNETPNIHFTLEKGGSITGRVVDTEGDPIAWVLIYAYNSDGNWVGDSESDSEGYYAVDGLFTGDYFVGTYNEQPYIDEWYQDADPDQNDPPPVHVDAPNETPNIHFTLEEGGSISGRVVDTGGDPTAWAGIDAYDSNGRWVGSGETDSEGHYTVNGLPTGDYYVFARYYPCNIRKWYQDADPFAVNPPPPPVYVVVSNETSDINFTLGFPDSDSDGISDCYDNCLKIPNGPDRGTCSGGENSGKPCDDSLDCPNGACIMDQVNSDGDEFGDACDNCPYTSNYSQKDFDRDGSGNACDPDDDNDGILDGNDYCPYDPGNDINNDGICGDDIDVDGVLGGEDNCPKSYNPNQEDTDRDGFGDVCDSENTFALVDYDTKKVAILDYAGNLLTEKVFHDPVFISSSVNGWLAKGCVWANCGNNWTIWDLKPDLSIRNTITGIGPGPLYAALTSGNFISGNPYTGIIDLYSTKGIIIDSVNVWKDKGGWPYDYADVGSIASLANGGFVVPPEGGYPDKGGGLYTPYLYFYDNNLNLINKVDITSENLHLFVLAGLSDGGFVATCADYGDATDVDYLCYFSAEGELIEKVDITADIPGRLDYTYILLTGLQEGGVMLTRFPQNKVWIYRSPPQELDLSGSGITSIGSIAGNIFLSSILYTITGRVLDAFSREPIVQVVVTTDGGGMGVSDQEGEYEFLQKPGRWWLEVRAADQGYKRFHEEILVEAEDLYIHKDISLYPHTTSTEECTTNADCDDGLYCTGVETCEDDKCQAGSDPCPDDGLYCNGEESCDEDNVVCMNSGNPCLGDLRCDETIDACVNCTGDGDCDDGLYCTGVETCANETCQLGSPPCPEGVTCDEESDVCNYPSITVAPQVMLQSRWIPLMAFLRINGTHTHFDGTSEVAFSPAGVMPLPFVWGKETIVCIGLMMPSFLTEPHDGTVEISVTTGLERVSAPLEVKPLLFMFDQEKQDIRQTDP